MTAEIDFNRTHPYYPLIATLPDELRSSDGWHYPGGLHAYMSALSDFIGGDRRVGPVMNAAGISVADWHRRALSSETTKNQPKESPHAVAPQ